ncbi:MAG: hypothetical protein M1834_004415 [Cirrosporium novae-zelandiae]|nr:MAG: hypothetical protein M1834_004415 [Cirrosporium novae-zelandiae]
MTTPVYEIPEPHYPNTSNSRSSDEDGTVIGSAGDNEHSHLRVEISHETDFHDKVQPSPSATREKESRLDDELAMLQAERVVSNTESEKDKEGASMFRSRSRHTEPVDEFDIATNPLHERTALYRPPENPSSSAAKFFKKVHQSSFLIRYFTYIVPIFAILLIPLLLGALLFKESSVGGVRLLWFSIWLEIVWLTLWGGRIAAKMIPWPLGVVASLFTNNEKKWRDLGKQLEVPATIFFWWLGVEISFLPTMTNHHIDSDKRTKEWERTMNKVLVAIFVGCILNFIEKIIIQLIAISFHLRTYADRIEVNKFQIGSLAKLYKFSKERIAMDDSEFEEHDESRPRSGMRTPGVLAQNAQRATKEVLHKVGDVAGKIAGDFTGRKVAKSTHPHQVVLTLLHTTSGSQVLARRLYRTFVRDGFDTVFSGDLKSAFDNDDEADAAFTMFDKDMNGDISMEELEAVCVEIGRERKSITASLKDLDSVVAKFDDVLFFVVVIITLVVFLSLVSASAAGVLTSAGSTVLALSWLLSATAQEFLQSIIFVFVKHPFDVGDRVSIYGNTGSTLTGDDYFVKEIALLYTEFKKMEGHVVQAPNSELNTLFILNMRRSGGLAEAIPIIIKFGTSLEQIDALRQRLLEFVISEKREYQSNILTELRAVTEAHSITLNVVFFYKSNWQNELLRLQRRNKFLCAMMVSMQELGIEGPRMRYPGQKQEQPFFVNYPAGTQPQNSADGSHDPQNTSSVANQHPSILRSSRKRGESLSTMAKRVDFSLGMSSVSSGDPISDIYEDRKSTSERMAKLVRDQSSSRSREREATIREEDEASAVATGARLSSSSHGRFSLRRTSTASAARSGASKDTHHNRFINRMRGNSVGNAGEDQDLMEQGVRNSADQRLDDRRGTIGSQAVRSDTNEELPQWEPRAMRRSQTENFAMRHLR